jgi:uracil-DNA glycosylase
MKRQQRSKNLLIFLALTLIISACSINGSRDPSGSTEKRGDSHEYDAGSDVDLQWADLFAETPNYRAYGKAVIGGGGEKFRWKMGPMWYRGRLDKNQVKVFVIGQEGAQDENVSNRSFTGSTGTRMQRFLNYFGITQSYLFMNTFVYTITGQYSLFGEDAKDENKVLMNQRLKWMAQDERSIVVNHRHRLFDYALSNNKDTMKLVVGVGTAGKESAATWARHHGVNCWGSTLTKSYCYGKTGALKGVLIVGLPHPGAASARNGGEGAMDNLTKSFRAKASIIKSHITTEKINLPIDSAGRRSFNKEFKYGYAAIPHRDFPYGTNWRMGKRGTTSNRRGSHTIQVFSDDGCYNNKCRDWNTGEDIPHNIKYDDPKDLMTKAPSEFKFGDVPYESPKDNALRRSYDAGPGVFAQTLTNLFTQVDYTKLGAIGHTSFGHTGIYRGRLNRAKVLVVTDQMSHDDMFSGRALSGAAGQKFQNYLNAIGATDSYAILRTLPVDTLGLDEKHIDSILFDDSVVSYRDKVLESILDKAKTQLIVTLGDGAKKVIRKFATDYKIKLPIINLDAPTGSYGANWTAGVDKFKTLDLSIDGAISTLSRKLQIIPRKDLPAYTRFWMGTSGNRVARSKEFKDGKYVANGNYYKIYVPKWAAKWKASESQLTEKELASVEEFKKTELATK